MVTLGLVTVVLPLLLLLLPLLVMPGMRIMPFSSALTTSTLV